MYIFITDTGNMAHDKYGSAQVLVNILIMFKK